MAKTFDELEEENRELTINNKIVDSEVKQRTISDGKYAPIEVKAWVIWFFTLVVAGAVLIWQHMGGL